MLNLSLNRFFKGIPLFASLEAEELSDLLRLVTPFTKHAGESLFYQGDPSDGMYVIERGEVGVFACPEGGDRVLLAELGNGALIGELSLIDGAPRSAQVETISMTSGYFLPKEGFETLRLGRSRGAYKLILELARTLEMRRRAAEKRLRSLVDAADPAELHTRELRELFGKILKG